MNSIINSKPKISVIMPVYNCALYVGEAIESILSQTFDDFEFLIIDDASTDATVAIVNSYDDPRIQLIQKPVNTGYTNSLNQGLKIAKGIYIARMDGDDYSKSERFAKQATYLDNHPETVLCATAYKFMGRDPFFGFPENHDSIKLALLNGNCICHPSVMMRKEMLDAHSITYDITKEPAEDYDMWIRLLTVGKLHILPEILVEYRVYANQVSSKRDQEQKNIDIELKFSLLNRLDFKMESEERALLEKYYNNKKNIEFNELSIFKQLQKKLSISNASCYFEPKLFQEYLTTLETSMLRRYFKNFIYYSPLLYLKYFIAKWNWNMELKRNEEFKFLVKCMLFRKIE